jgi:hypothetical protein
MAPDGPPLAVPAPPPRVLAPVEELIPLPETPATPAETPAPAPPARARTPPRRGTGTGTEPEPRPDVPAASPPAAAAPPVAEPPRELRPAPSAADAAQEKKIQDVIVRAGRDLMRIDYRRLSAQGREQYDQAKQFSEQAEQALTDRNFVYALTLADKAATLAGALRNN